MSKWNPIVSGRRALAALRDLLRQWCLGVGSGPSRRVTANGFSPGAYRARQIIAERRGDAARMRARPQLCGDYGRISAPKDCKLEIPLPIPCQAIFSAVSARKIPLPNDMQIESVQCRNHLIRIASSAMSATNFELHCDALGEFSLLAGKSRARGAGPASRVGAVPRSPRHPRAHRGWRSHRKVFGLEVGRYEAASARFARTPCPGCRATPADKKPRVSGGSRRRPNDQPFPDRVGTSAIALPRPPSRTPSTSPRSPLAEGRG